MGSKEISFGIFFTIILIFVAIFFLAIYYDIKNTYFLIMFIFSLFGVLALATISTAENFNFKKPILTKVLLGIVIVCTLGTSISAAKLIAMESKTHVAKVPYKDNVN